MIFQDPMTSLNPLFTVGDQLTEVLRLKSGVGAREARREAAELLERVGIEPASSRLGDYPHQLSGGMRQRVMIAIAVAARPQLLLADEPTTALDVRVQQQILKLIADLQREMGMATILVSHDVAVVGQVCDEVAVMYAGRIVERGPVDDVLDQPRHPYTEGLVRAVEQVNTLSGSARSSLETMPGQPPALTDLGEGCSFAPRCPLRQRECEHYDMRLDGPSVAHPAACLVRQREVERSEVM
jgi:oligopeptide/dipeptide ABC transporter ATP-binding protein